MLMATLPRDGHGSLSEMTDSWASGDGDGKPTRGRRRLQTNSSYVTSVCYRYYEHKLSPNSVRWQSRDVLRSTMNAVLPP